MNERLEVLQLLAQDRKRLTRQRAELKDKGYSLRQRAGDISREFISSALNKFLASVAPNSWQEDSYINGSYSDDFTFFVKKNNLPAHWSDNSPTLGLNDAHTKALATYRAAFKDLNITFLNAIRTPEGYERFLHTAGVKNLTKNRG